MSSSGKDGYTPLGELASVSVGHVGPMASRYVPEGIPFLRSQNVQRHRLDLRDVRYIDLDFHSELKKSSLQPGDVVVVRTGAPGTAAVVPKDLSEANCADLVVIRPDAQLDSRFLSYYINGAAQFFVRSRLVGAVQQHFNISAARELLIPNLRRSEQEAIAEVLGALDDKIESNRRLAALLEETAAVLFRARFIDFVGETSLVESNSGVIPRGWNTVPIGTVVRLRGGGTPSTKVADYWDGGMHAWATPKDLAGLEFLPLLGTSRRLTDAGLSKVSSGLLPRGTVLLSSRAPIGYVAITEVETAINQGFIAMVCDGPLPNQYVAQWVSAHMDRIKAAANGTTFQEISKKSFGTLSIPMPPPDVLADFRGVAEALYRRVVGCVRETAVIAEVRDALLPKLVSGEIRVRDAENSVEAA